MHYNGQSDYYILAIFNVNKIAKHGLTNIQSKVSYDFLLPHSNCLAYGLMQNLH